MWLGWRTFITTCLGALWKVFLCFCFLFTNQWSLLLNIQRLLIISCLQSFIRLKTRLTPHPSPFIGPDSTPSASIKFFLDSSFSVFLNADPNHTFFLKMIPLKTPPTQLLCLFRCFLLVLLTTIWQSLLSRAVHRHEASRQPRVNFFPICSSVGFVVFLFSRWITQSVFVNTKWLTGWNTVKYKCDFQKIQIETITDMELKWLTLFDKKNDQT